ncbi:hypothetical protein N9R04_01405 [Staphylococcus sp. SQ8-PEA]|uniref:Uncharacterized protein n=1 Tax=Staphylococcus marylandisciuri TaxID=2981529 RepID=A0ABT2QN37_9STAP|nr:hypothetical protein [Staphylococcus marylandisciuri]MCU5745376.1 hypothetical protein [Staphylococcus marylandisciuri]
MKRIFKSIIAILILLGIVKTFHDYDLENTIEHYVNRANQGDVLQSIENVNFDNLKHFNFEDLHLSDFF